MPDQGNQPSQQEPALQIVRLGQDRVVLARIPPGTPDDARIRVRVLIGGGPGGASEGCGVDSCGVDF